MQPPSKRKRWVGMAVAVGVLAAVVLTWRVLAGQGQPTTASANGKPAEQVVVVTVEPVTARPVARNITVVGSLYGWDEVVLTPKVEGRVLRILHDVGDVVKPGELLLEIDPTDYKLAVAEARRALDLELARLGLKQLPQSTLDVASLPPVARAAALQNQASTRAERMRRLAGTRSASPEDVQQAETDLEVAQANHRQMILEAEATLAAARHRQAALETAEQRLKDTLIVAPTPSARDGSGPVEYAVCHRGVVEGEIVRTFPFGMESTSLFRLAIDRQLKLKVTVPERHRAAVKVGQEATLEVEAYVGERFQGKVARISPAVDRASRTFQVEISVPNPERRLSPGSFARATIHTRVDTGARTVPEEALVSFAGVTKVFTLEGAKAREVHVRRGASLTIRDGGRSHTWIEVEGDLAVGARVVTSGQSKLADGTAVRVRGKTMNDER